MPNLFIAMMAPVICDTLYLRLCGTVKMPVWLDGSYITQSIYDMGSPGATLLVKLGTTLAITLVLGIISCLMIRRRLLRE